MPRRNTHLTAVFNENARRSKECEFVVVNGQLKPTTGMFNLETGQHKLDAYQRNFDTDDIKTVIYPSFTKRCTIPGTESLRTREELEDYAVTFLEKFWLPHPSTEMRAVPAREIKPAPNDGHGGPATHVERFDL